MKRQQWPGMASRYCRASDSIRLSREKITQAIHTHIGSECVSIWVCVHALVRQRQSDETHHLFLHCKAFIWAWVVMLFGVKITCLIRGKCSVRMCMCVCVCVCVCVSRKKIQRERSQTMLLYNCQWINKWPQHWQANPIRGQRLEVRLQR